MKIKLLTDPYLFEYYSVVLLLIILLGSSFYIKRIRPLQSFFGILLILIPVSYFYWSVNTHIVNIPFTDDYNLLQSLYDLTHKEGLLDKTKALFSQINQHRFAYERIVMWLILIVTGSENITFQIVVGNMFLIGIGYLFYKTLKREGISWYAMIPIAFMLFNLVYYENANWGIAAIQNTSLIFFVLLSVYALGSNGSGNWYLALIVALVASFTSGSGLLVWLIGGIIMIFQKKFKKLLVWACIAIIVYLFYFLFDYQIIGSSGNGLHILYSFLFLLAFWGNALFLDKAHPLISGHYYDLAACVALGVAIGFVSCFWFVRFIKQCHNKTSVFVTGSFLFLMGTGAMLVLSRPIDFYVTSGGEVLSRRYMIFGVALLITAYTALIILLKPYRTLTLVIYVSAMTLAVGLNFVSYFMSASQLRRQTETLSLDPFYWRNYGMLMSFGSNFNEKLFWNHPTQMTRLINDLESSRIYSLPDIPLPLVSNQLSGISAEKESFSGSIHYVNEQKFHPWTNKYVDHFSLAYSGSSDSDFSVLYFQLKSKDHLFVLPAYPIVNNLSNFLISRTYYSNQREYSSYSQKFARGNYEVWVVGTHKSSNRQKWKAQFTGRQIQL